MSGCQKRPLAGVAIKKHHSFITVLIARENGSASTLWKFAAPVQPAGECPMWASPKTQVRTTGLGSIRIRTPGSSRDSTLNKPKTGCSASYGKLEARGGGLAIVSAPFFRRPGIGIVFALCRARSAWLQDAIAKAPKRLEPSCDFRARLDPIGVDDVLPLQFPIVGLGKYKVGGHGRHRNYARSGSMAIKRNQKPGHGCYSHTRNHEYIVAARDVAPEVRIAAMPN
jgi:hypothetical protein